MKRIILMGALYGISLFGAPKDICEPAPTLTPLGVMINMYTSGRTNKHKFIQMYLRIYGLKKWQTEQKQLRKEAELFYQDICGDENKL